jgi:hypothetical protein
MGDLVNTSVMLHGITLRAERHAHEAR